MISRPPTFTSKGAAGEAVFILHCPKGPPAVRENFGFDRPELNRIAGQRLAQGLAGASPADLSEIEISPAGLGLHRPQLDADLYVPAILQGVFGSKRWMPLNWARLADRPVPKPRPQGGQRSLTCVHSIDLVAGFRSRKNFRLPS